MNGIDESRPLPEVTDAGRGLPGSDPAFTADWTMSLAMPLVRGLSHALSNRVGALGVLLEIVLDPEATPEERATYEAQLLKEMAQLAAINQQLGLLAPDRAAPEPLLVPDVVDKAVQLATLHRDRRGGELQVTVSGTAVPVRVCRWAMVHAIVAVIDVVSREAGTCALRVALGGSDGEVEILVSPQPDPSAAGVVSGAPGRRQVGLPVRLAPQDARESRRTAEHLAACMGGSVRDGGAEALALRLPSLAALRERRAPH